ncbi:hypothetical protein M0R45_026158 [Rubus argutus]|uniref:Uncharacterized protein n=1 Tax=Rubus argutus TaxID=59490 RepID=A0AAW1WWT4_RUBAR
MTSRMAGGDAVWIATVEQRSDADDGWAVTTEKKDGVVLGDAGGLDGDVDAVWTVGGKEAGGVEATVL